MTAAEGQFDLRGFTTEEGVSFAHPITIAAYKDALSRRHVKEAESRIRNGLKRLEAAVIESESIAEQLNSAEYQQEVAEMDEFFECAIVGDTICPDGRIDPLNTIGPKPVVLHQRPAAISEVRRSSSKLGAMMTDDPNTTASLWNAVEKTKARTGGDAEIVQFGGPHINSEDPIHGCGGLKEAVSKQQNPTDGMRFGAIAKYYQDLGLGFFAFDTFAETFLKIPSRTFDLTHDIYSQGLITGLRDAYPHFDTGKTLRENLIQMHQSGEIVMTEFLDPMFRGRIQNVYQELFPEGGPINRADYTQLAKNLIKVGQVARRIAREEETRGFDFIPEHLMEGATPIARKVLAYTLIRNTVFRTLAGIRPGNHGLLKHNERWMRVGSSGPLTIDNVSFVLRTPSGYLREADLEDLTTLEGILDGALRGAGADVNSEAKVIVVCGIFEPEKYIDKATAEQEREFAISRVGNDAARIRNQRPEDIENGRRVVLGALIGKDRTITEIVR
jgi:hypothetical protein